MERFWAKNRKEIMDRENPSFFKVLIGDFSDQLQIPPAFVKHFFKVLPFKPVLCSSAKRFWHVNVEKTGNDVYFGKGWREFVQDNALEFGDFLVFSYDGDLKFDVKMYGKHGCEMEVTMATRTIYKPIPCKRHGEKENAMRGKIWSGKREANTLLLHEEERQKNVSRLTYYREENENEIIHIDSDSDDETGKPTLHGEIKTKKLKIEPDQSKELICKESKGRQVTQRHSFSSVVEASQQRARALEAARDHFKLSFLHSCDEVSLSA